MGNRPTKQEVQPSSVDPHELTKQGINVAGPTKPPSDEPSELTRQAIAEMSATKRNTIIYERRIDELSVQVQDLTKKNESLQKRSDHFAQHCARIPQMKRGKLELYVSSIVASVLMAVGGGLISSFPISNGVVPWEFAVGWTLLAMAIVSGLVLRPIVSWLYYKWIGKEDGTITAFVEP